MFLVLSGCDQDDDKIRMVEGINDDWVSLFGEMILMDSVIVDSILSGSGGDKILLDTNNDGAVETLYFIDRSQRHGNEKQPLVVKVIDQDGDMADNPEGDQDSDLYIADWFGDGSIDGVIDYNDFDGDNDLDEQLLYSRGEEGIMVTWARDFGDDNKLWKVKNYVYKQYESQWDCDFNGDEMFVFTFLYDGYNKLSPRNEIAFAFYDLDGDNFSEEAVRLSGKDGVADDLRYSMDIDNDNHLNKLGHHDYDFSLSCIGPNQLPGSALTVLNIQSIESGAVMDWEKMRETVKSLSWKPIHLTWDENDNNINYRNKNFERWEGVISHENEFVRGVGSPSGGPFNKRNEVDVDGSGAMKLYFSEVDQRIHLFGAEQGWINVDFNYDEITDFMIEMSDENKDGFIDYWRYDVDADGVPDREYKNPDASKNKILEFEYQAISSVYNPALENVLINNQQIIMEFKRILKIYIPDFTEGEIEAYFNGQILSYGAHFYQLGKKIQESKEGQRYYGDLIKERYWHLLNKTDFRNHPDLPKVKTYFESGEYANLIATLKGI